MTGQLTAIRSRRVVFPDGVRPAALTIHQGRIAAVRGYGEPVDAADVVDMVDCGDDALLPGLVDIHVHVNEPGRTDWEGFASATRAAAAGGVTTLLDMPLNSIPPTLDPPALAAKRRAAGGACRVDVGFWGGVVPGNLGRLAPLHDAGVFGFKCFLADSGVPEFPPLDAGQLAAAMAEVAGLDGLLIVHAESAAALRPAPPGARYRDFLGSRPAAAEVDAVRRVAELAGEHGTRVHLLHVSAAGALTAIADAKRHGARLTAETCPHYLTLAAERVPDGATEFKCCPPIRERANRERLWAGLAGGTLDCVASDHSPAPPELKLTGCFATAWGGIASLQLGLPVVWTGARRRGYGLVEVARWLADAPARVAGLAGKGRIAPGYAADLVRFDPDAPSTVDPDALAHRHPVTPYAGRALTGAVRASWLAGARTGAPPAGDPPAAHVVPAGRLITRGAA